MTKFYLKHLDVRDCCPSFLTPEGLQVFPNRTESVDFDPSPSLILSENDLCRVSVDKKNNYIKLKQLRCKAEV